jgi:triacylglycerol lipase
VSNLTTLLRPSYGATAFDGFSTDRDFNLGTAGALIWMSQLAYETTDPDKVSDILGSWQLRCDGIVQGLVRSVLPIADTHAVVASGRGATILSFAGTDPVSLANWVSDFNFRAGAGGIADGFHQAFDAVQKQVFALARTANQPLFVTGHSLGGALAVIAAQALQSSGFDVAGVYTFGMPRPGDEAFARVSYDPLLGSRTYRLVHGNDIVPTVAPSTLGPRHVGRLLRCDPGAAFDPATLSPTTESDDPLFSDAAGQQLTALLNHPAAELAGVVERLALVARIAVSSSPVHGRAPSVAVMVEALPPPIRDHLPDCYINALGAGPL